MRRQKTYYPTPAALAIVAEDRQRERQIARIREKIDTHRRTGVTEYPINPVLQRQFEHYTDEQADQIDTDYRRAIIEELEWVLREVFEVTP